jgi:cardiolipin synthase
MKPKSLFFFVVLKLISLPLWSSETLFLSPQKDYRQRAGDQVAGQIRLIKDEKAFPRLKKYNGYTESCQYTSSESHLPIEKLFLGDKYDMMTCAQPTGDIAVLTEPEDGILSKLEILLGQKPSLDLIKNQNPYVELDFSKAPKLDAIFVSTLFYRKDFTGMLLARALKFHAARGTLINVIGTGYMHNDNADDLLKELRLSGGNVRVQDYKYRGEKVNLQSLRVLTNYLRNMHVKLFVTLSAAEPQHNYVIVGGGNVHEGFVFGTKPDLSTYPELDQAGDGPWEFWNDLEIKNQSQALAETVYGHLTGLWNRTRKGQKVDAVLNRGQAPSISGDEVLNAQAPMMRHFMSVPFSDDRALETLFVDMLDRAQKTVQLSSPCLRPTNKIMNAPDRAIERGVNVTIQTRIDLSGDTASWLYEEANKAAINALFDKVTIYEWTEQSILHTKLLIVDESVAFLGSVNLSWRSFIQDVESGFLIHNPKFVGDLVQLLKGYNARSHKIGSEQKRRFWAGVVMSMFQNQV